MRPTSPRPEIVGPASPTAPFPIAVSGPVVRGFGRGSAELGIPTANIPLSGLSVGGYDDLDSGVYFGWCALDVDPDGRWAGSGDDSGGGDRNANKSDKDVGEEDRHTKTPASILNTSSTLIPPVPVPVPIPTSSTPTKNPSPIDPRPPQETSTYLHIYPMVLSLGYNPFYGNTVRSIETHVIHHFPHDFYGAHMRLLICGYVRPEYDYVSVDALVDDIRTDIRVAERSLLRDGYLRLRQVEPEPELERGAEGREPARVWWRPG